jgi:dihydroflavonol-4-reductase
MMKVAITGAGGHIGNNLSRALSHRATSVKALCHQDVRALKDLPVTRVYGDILDPDSLQECFRDVDVVYHLASVISITGGAQGRVREVNENGTQNVVNACLKSGVQRLIHFSSIHALEQKPQDEILDESRPLVDESGSIYDQSKAEEERIVSKGVSQGLDAVIVNPTAIIGPHDYKPSLMGTGLIALYRGSLPALVPGGFNWVDVRDVVVGAINVCEYGKTGERYLLPGTWAELKQLAVMVESISGNPAPRFMCPIWLARLGLPFIRAYTSLNGTRMLYTSESLSALTGANSHISSNKAEQLFMYQHRSLRLTLEDTFQWFQNNEMLE